MSIAQGEFYRKSTIGVALTDALDEMVATNLITPTLGMAVMAQFDKSINEALETKVKTKCTFKGHCQMFRFCDEVWTFVLENTTFRTDTETISVDKVKIVATDAKCFHKEENSVSTK